MKYRRQALMHLPVAKRFGFDLLTPDNYIVG